MKKNLIVIFILLCLVAYGSYDYFSKASSSKGNSLDSASESLEVGIEKGDRAPDFELNDLQGNPIRLSDLEGKIVFVNFWATWCPPCRIEMPHMQKIYENYQSKDVVIVGVNLTPSEKNEDAVQEFVDKAQLTFPIVLDQTGEVNRTYQVVAYPTTYILDSKGIIKEKYRGAINYEMMENAIAKIK